MGDRVLPVLHGTAERRRARRGPPAPARGESADPPSRGRGTPECRGPRGSLPPRPCGRAGGRPRARAARRGARRGAARRGASWRRPGRTRPGSPGPAPRRGPPPRRSVPRSAAPTRECRPRPPAAAPSSASTSYQARITMPALMVTARRGACGNTKRTGVRRPRAGTIGTKSEPSAPRPWSQMTDVSGSGPVSTSRPSGDSRSVGRPSARGGRLNGCSSLRAAPPGRPRSAASPSRSRAQWDGARCPTTSGSRCRPRASRGGPRTSRAGTRSSTPRPSPGR